MDYEKQADDFLEATNTKITSEFKEFGSMPFDTDGAKRNIFKVTIKNSKGEYIFNFGTSLNDSLKLEQLMEIS